jgi:hypothetical protein
VNIFGAVFKLLADGNCPLRTNIGTPTTVGAAPADVLNDAHFLAGIKHQNFTGRTVVGAPSASDTLFRIKDRAATKTF